MNNKKAALASFFGALLGLFPATANASDEAVSSAQIQEIMHRLEKLENLIKEQGVAEKDIKKEVKEVRKLADRIKTNSTYGNAILDPTNQINRKQQYILNSKIDGLLTTGDVTLSGSIWATADYQQSNMNDKFGWLMRHPTFRNQKGKEVSHALIHSAQISATYPANEWITIYSELLYDPEQSFGSGTITDVNRNQIQLRKGYVLFGDLNKSPFHFSIGTSLKPFP